MFEEARSHGEVVSPPAGAIGRGDAFLLRIAEKSNATVLSNDSFQEFHGEHEWLFDKDRLVGGVPVPGVGWIFTPRTPVRGPRSRESVREAKRSKGPAVTKAAARPAPMPVPKGPPPRRTRRKPVKEETVEEAIAAATEEAVGEPAPSESRRRRRRRAGPPAQAGNDPLTFITFVSERKLGGDVGRKVDRGAIFEAPRLCAHQRDDLQKLGQEIVAVAGLQLDRGEDVDHVTRADRTQAAALSSLGAAADDALLFNSALLQHPGCPKLHPGCFFVTAPRVAPARRPAVLSLLRPSLWFP